jgi:hypothetical protein
MTIRRFDRDYKQNQQGGGGGGGQDQSAEDLADLFELETDKLRNQYEEVRRGEAQTNSAKMDETLERLKQLAARQQQENERLRQRMQQGAGGSGGGGGQRDLAQEAEEMARQLERLAREQKSPEMEESARKLQEAATAMRRSAAANGDASRASGAAALDRLERARRLLEQGKSSQLTKGAQDAAQRAAELARQQKEVAEDVAGLPNAGGTRPDRERRLDERKQAMAGEVKSLEEDLTRMARETRKDSPETARKMQEAAGALRDNRTADKIQYSREVMRRGSPDYARAFEGQISEDLEGLRDRIAAAARGAGSDTSQRKSQALDRARDLVRGLSSLDDRMREKEQRGLRGAPNGQQQPQDGQQGANQPNGNQGKAGQQGSQAQGERGEGQSKQGQRGQQGQGQDGQGQQGQEGKGQ